MTKPPSGAQGGLPGATIERDPPALAPGTGNLPPFGSLPAPLRSVLVAEDNATFRGYLRDLQP